MCCLIGEKADTVANKDPIRVGVLFSKTGVTSTIGRSQTQGTLLAIDEINQAGGIDGREIIPVCYDARSSPAAYVLSLIHISEPTRPY